MKPILVLNAGSSSIKYQLFDMPDEKVLARGIVEKIGESGSRIKYSFQRESGEMDSHTETSSIPDHEVGLQLIADKLSANAIGKDEIGAVGHRVVHGGEKFSLPAVIDGSTIHELKELSHLAPLHNPANILGIQVAEKTFPGVPQVAVFDTAFHQTMPEKAYRYAIPQDLYTEHAIRVYGFHGTSHAFVAKEASRHLKIDLDSFNGITIHLGNGCSMAAISQGKSVDTSMGLTPLDGLIMGTRSGQIDPSLIFFLHNHLGIELSAIDKLLNKQSGLKGLTGDQDVRNNIERFEGGDEQAQLAIDMYAYRIKKYIGAYLAALGQCHAIVFTGGVGENSSLIREKVCQGLENLGITMDPSKNNSTSNGSTAIHESSSDIQILVIPTNEELEIARQVVALVD